MSDPWAVLRRHTAARIGLGRAGTAVPTGELIDFAQAHASARDAVWTPWDADATAAELDGVADHAVVVCTPVRDRSEYLRRPDLGRTLAEGHGLVRGAWDVGIVLTNGLSSTAVVRHGAELVRLLVDRLADLALAPVVLVPDGRVAVGDPIGAALGVRLVVLVVGERPGLSSADGLGIYLTFAPRPGRTDAERNCISNVRPNGLPLPAAADKAAWLAHEALRRGLTGVGLKDDSPRLLG